MSKKIIYLIFAIISIICLCGCNNISNKKDYTLCKENDNYFIIVNDSYYEKNISRSERGDLEFESVNDFLYKIKNEKFTEDELNVIVYAFNKDEKGNIAICDIDKMIAPVEKNGYVNKKFFWNGENYAYYAEKNNDSFYYLYYCTKESFQKQFEHDYKNFFDKTNINLIDQKKIDDNKTEYNYSTTVGMFKSIRYEINVNDKNILVDERYRLSSENKELEVSSTIPYKVTLYITEPNNYYYLTIYGMTESPTKDMIIDFQVDSLK